LKGPPVRKTPSWEKSATSLDPQTREGKKVGEEEENFAKTIPQDGSTPELEAGSEGRGNFLV